MAVGGAGREGGGEEGELVRAEVADAGANLVGDVLPAGGLIGRQTGRAGELEARQTERVS